MSGRHAGVAQSESSLKSPIQQRLCAAEKRPNIHAVSVQLARIDACRASVPTGWRGKRTCEHDIEHDTAGPDVCGLAVIVVIKQDLRRDVVRRPADRFGPRIHKLVLAVAEVAQLHPRLRQTAIQKSVLQLDVPAASRTITPQTCTEQVDSNSGTYKLECKNTTEEENLWL